MVKVNKLGVNRLHVIEGEDDFGAIYINGKRYQQGFHLFSDAERVLRLVYKYHIDIGKIAISKPTAEFDQELSDAVFGDDCYPENEEDLKGKIIGTITIHETV